MSTHAGDFFMVEVTMRGLVSNLVGEQIELRLYNFLIFVENGLNTK